MPQPLEVSDLELCVDILGKHSRVDEALHEIRTALGRRLSERGLRHSLSTHGFKSPGCYLESGQLVAEDDKAPGLDQLGRWIAAAAEELEEDPRQISQRDVCSVTPAEPAHFRAHGGFAKVRRDAFDEATKAAPAEKAGLAARDAYVRRLEREVGRRDYLGDRLSRALADAFERSPIKLSSRRHAAPTAPDERLLTAMISDCHFGLFVDPREVPLNQFNWQIASRRMALLATQIADWKPNRRKSTGLRLVINGDVLAGLIHLDDSGVRRITEQIHGATCILVSFVDYLRQFFGRIDVTCLPGNHDRTARDRQYAQRWDSHAHSIYLGMAMAFRHDAGVSFDVPRTGEGVVELPGGDALAFYTHGDVAPTIANAGRSLDIRPIVDTVHKLNSTGEYDKPVRVVGWGHWHTGLVMPTGIATAVVNGSVIGPDPYARNGVGVRGEMGAPMQLLFESVPGFPFGDSRFIHLRPADDDSSLDEVIPTPELG